ncbi:MAG: methyltransferase domain-containing protein [Deltaproteobacteria bacterium]|nr:methyltransferase domain-containing protein [Deltaproteobacteria bacterium]
MPLQCPIELDVDRLRQEIQDVYSQVATAPDGDFHFHRGPVFASQLLDYDAAELAQLPSAATASFAGVGNPLSIDPLHPGEVVVDLGSGAGMDLLLAAKRVGATGQAIGIDMTDAMLSSASASAQEIGADQVELRKGDLLELPLEDDSVDVVISNGVLNLAPDKVAAFSEITRVLKPGGRLLLADIVMSGELNETCRSDIDLWAG